ncbi:hypothetical protein A3767_01755 [Oleiphilus sp. HI0133]|nr:hypothetical protein A3767_01755 [Oleiphilus sp. HI0133]
MNHQAKAQYQKRTCNTLFALSVLVVTMGLSTNSHAEVYKWVDEQGNIHFGDRPPVKEQATNLSDTLQPLNLSTDLSNPNMIRNAEQSRKDALDRKAQEQHKRVNSASTAAQEYCKQAKKRLYDISGPVVFYDENGKAMNVTERERKRMEQELRAEIDKNCK